MTGVIIGLIILASVLLILFVMAQNSKGGVGGQLGGGGVSQIVGVKKGADLLEQLTWGCAIFIMAGSILINVMYTGDSEDITEESSSNIEVAKSKSGIQAEEVAVPGAEGEEASSIEEEAPIEEE